MSDIHPHWASLAEHLKRVGSGNYRVRIQDGGWATVFTAGPLGESGITFDHAVAIEILRELAAERRAREMADYGWNVANKQREDWMRRALTAEAALDAARKP